MNRAALLMALADGPPVEFVSAAAGAGATGASAAVVTKPSGLALDDLVVVFVDDTDAAVTLVTDGGAAWTKSYLVDPLTSSGGYAVFWKLMAAVDLTGDWDLSYGGQGAYRAHYRNHGATTVTLKGSDDGPTLSGFTKAAGHYGVLSFLALPSGAAATAPSGFDVRYSSAPIASRIAIADKLIGYVDGAAVTWTGFGTNSATLLFEVTGP